MVENLHFVFINKDLLLDWRLTEFSQFTNFNHISKYIEIPREVLCEEDAVECVHVQPYQLHHKGGLDEFVPDRGYKRIHIDVVLNLSSPKCPCMDAKIANFIGLIIHDRVT